MPPPTKLELSRLHDETGFQPRTLERVVRLLDILQAVADDGFLGGQLALKGGTALNAFHLDHPRLSVDLDLSYVGPATASTLQAERARVAATITGILAGQGCTIKPLKRPTALTMGEIRFRSVFGPLGTLKIDVSYDERPPLRDAARMSSFPLGRWRAENVLVLDREEVVAGKLAALFTRTRPRDLFDARSIMKMAGLSRIDIRPMYLTILAASGTGWRDVSIRPDPLRGGDARQKLLECLARGYFDGYEGGVDEWADESVELCREHYAPYAVRAPDEREFLSAVLDHGEVRTDLLFARPDILARIASYQWLARRCQQVLKRGEAAAEPPRPRPRGPSRGL